MRQLASALGQQQEVNVLQGHSVPKDQMSQRNAHQVTIVSHTGWKM